MKSLLPDGELLWLNWIGRFRGSRHTRPSQPMIARNAEDEPLPSTTPGSSTGQASADGANESEANPATARVPGSASTANVQACSASHGNVPPAWAWTSPSFTGKYVTPWPASSEETLASRGGAQS